MSISYFKLSSIIFLKTGNTKQWKDHKTTRAPTELIGTQNNTILESCMSSLFLFLLFFNYLLFLLNVSECFAGT